MWLGGGGVAGPRRAWVVMVVGAGGRDSYDSGGGCDGFGGGGSNGGFGSYGGTCDGDDGGGYNGDSGGGVGSVWLTTEEVLSSEASTAGTRSTSSCRSLLFSQVSFTPLPRVGGAFWSLVSIYLSSSLPLCLSVYQCLKSIIAEAKNLVPGKVLTHPMVPLGVISEVRVQEPIGHGCVSSPVINHSLV